MFVCRQPPFLVPGRPSAHTPSSIHTGGGTCGHCFAPPSSWLRAHRVIGRAPRRPPGRRTSMPGLGKAGRSGARRTPGRIGTAVAPDGSLRGTLTYTSVTAPPIPIRARDVSDSAVVNEIGPYHSITANADVVTTTTGKVRGDSLNGTFEMRPAGGGNVIMTGNFRSKRVVP